MKKHLLLLTALLVGLTACERPHGEEQRPVPEISINSEELIFSADGGERGITITSNYDWGVEHYEYSNWCRPSKSYGSNGEVITFTVDPFTDTKERSTTFIFTCYGNDYGSKDEVTLTITQTAKEYSISLDEPEIVFDCTGGNIEIVVNSSDDWSLKKDADWFYVSKDKGKSGDIITIRAYDNFGGYPAPQVKTGTITFTCGNKTLLLSVSQKIDDSPIINFTDPRFLSMLLKIDGNRIYFDGQYRYIYIDRNNDKKISEKEANAVQFIEFECDMGSPILNMDELKQYFVSLEYLSIGRTAIQTLDLSGLEKLKEFESGYDDELVSIDLKNCSALEHIECLYHDNLDKLNLEGCDNIKEVRFGDIGIEEFNCTNRMALENVTIFSCDMLTSVNVSGCSSLTKLSCGNAYPNPSLKFVNVEGCISLEELFFRGCQVNELDVSGCTALTFLSCSGNQLTTLDLSKNTALEFLYCGNNQLTTLDLSGCIALGRLSCDDNHLVNLDLSRCIALEFASCNNNNLTTLDISKNRLLGDLSCKNNPLTSITAYEYSYDNIKSYLMSLQKDIPNLEIIYVK